MVYSYAFCVPFYHCNEKKNHEKTIQFITILFMGLSFKQLEMNPRVDCSLNIFYFPFFRGRRRAQSQHPNTAGCRMQA